MVTNRSRSIRAVGLTIAAFFVVQAASGGLQSGKSPKVSVSRLIVSRGNPKLAPDLGDLVDLSRANRGANPNSKKRYAALAGELGFSVKTRNPAISVTVRLESNSTPFKAPRGSRVLFRSGRYVSMRVRIGSLRALAASAGVSKVSGVYASHASIPYQEGTHSRAKKGPKAPSPARAIANPLPHNLKFNGHGVAVGIIDTGIDWKSKDFQDGKGHTRILALYDLFDDSYARSEGKVGSPPPFKDDDGAPLGTLYTREQINEALEGKGVVNSRDEFGHGTAVASIAAGNGTSAGSHRSTVKGMAPGADLIIVRAGDGTGKVIGASPAFSSFILSVAKRAHEPVVINCSFGNVGHDEDGSSDESKQLDELFQGQSGVAMVVAAGNDGNSNIHADAKILGSDAGQAPSSREVTYESKKEGNQQVTAFFSKKDDWGLAFTGEDSSYPASADGQHAWFMVYRQSGKTLIGVGGDGISDEDQQAGLAALHDIVTVDRSDPKFDKLTISLPAGDTTFAPFGADENVTSGEADLYLADGALGRFTKGATNRHLVSSPGVASSVITVGAYVGLNHWDGQAAALANQAPGMAELCDYSSPGYRLDGVIKPDICAPGTFWISPMVSGSVMREEAEQNDMMVFGNWGAWEGTSAATPYITGLVALMLEKNPHLTAPQIKAILEKTSYADANTGMVPSPQSGHGKANPAKAIAATP